MSQFEATAHEASLTQGVVEHNRRSWDRLVSQGHTLTRPVSGDEIKNASKILDPIGWLEGDLTGRKVLCLAAGGGRFSTLFATLGAIVTVLDISPAMLEIDRKQADKYRLSIRCIQADMSNMSSIDDDQFDLVMQPVSTTYLSEPRFAFAETARVTRAGGIYVSFHKQPMNLQASLEVHGSNYRIERPVESVITNSTEIKTRLREAGTIEHAHSLQTLLGGICRAGFAIEDVTEPQYADVSDPPNSFGHRCSFIPPYIALKARRLPTKTAQSGRSELIV